MLRLAALCGIVVLLATSALAETFTGVITDARDGAKHAPYAPADIAAMKKCFSQGAIPVLLTEAGKTMSILYTSVDKVLPFAGQKVTITGKLEQNRGGDLLIVESVAKAK